MASGQSPTPLFNILIYANLLLRTAFICAFLAGRIRFLHIDDDDDQSPFESNRVFKITGIVAVSVVWVLALLLCFIVSNGMKYIHYTVLKFIGSFCAFLAPFSLMMVLVLPPELNWTAYLAVCVMLVIMVVCFCLDVRRYDERSYSFTFDTFVVLLVVVLAFFVFCAPSNLDRMVYPAVYVTLSMEIAYHVITYLLFIVHKSVTKVPNDLEANDLTQQDNNDHPRSVDSYL